jgi:NAD-dependent SIR2 family protein deacetylase
MIASIITQEILHIKSQIVMLSDANILVNARCKRFLPFLKIHQLTIFLLILDFCFKIDLHRSQRKLFDISIYNNNENTQDFYHIIEELYNKSLRVVFTSFHFFLKRLVASSQSIRYYTQNINCIKNNLSYLKSNNTLTIFKKQRFKTIQLHKRLRTMICQKCRLKNFFASKLFHNISVLIYSRCDKIKIRKIVKDKRLRDIERLKSRIVLYREANLDESVIE